MRIPRRFGRLRSSSCRPPAMPGIGISPGQAESHRLGMSDIIGFPPLSQVLPDGSISGKLAQTSARPPGSGTKVRLVRSPVPIDAILGFSGQWSRRHGDHLAKHYRWLRSNYKE